MYGEIHSVYSVKRTRVLIVFFSTTNAIDQSKSIANMAKLPFNFATLKQQNVFSDEYKHIILQYKYIMICFIQLW